jgi:hypothetical protein
VSAVIAERLLQIDGQMGRENGFVRLYAPVPERDGREWKCELHISWPGFEMHRSIFGIDSYQALLLAMRHVTAQIEMSDAFKANRLHEFDSETPLSDLKFSFGFDLHEGKPQ